MTRDPHLVEVFEREFEATRSLEAAVAAVATAVIARRPDARDTTAPRPGPAAIRWRVRPAPAPWGARMAQVAELSKQGVDTLTMSTRLGASREAVLMAKFRARNKGLLPPCQRHVEVTPQQIAGIQAAVARLCGETPHCLFAGGRVSRARASARWVAASVLRRLGMSASRIAVHVGLADHSTVIYGLRQVEARAELAAQADEIWRRLAPAEPGPVPNPALVGAEGVAA